ncbi:MAG: hypothetical protein AB4372_10730 [Xenococcus sp. (in: cyanobacteria)]
MTEQEKKKEAYKIIELELRMLGFNALFEKGNSKQIQTKYCNNLILELGDINN